MSGTRHLTMVELEAGLDAIRQSPKEQGTLEMIVRRPQVNARDVLEEGALDLAEGLVGDSWRARGSSKAADGVANRDTQLNVMNARVIALLAQTRERWALAGDQLYVDLDLSAENLPPGTRLEIGTAVIEVTSEPHNGCKKFKERFGAEALQFVNSPLGKQLHLRGVNARVVRPGIIRMGDVARKMAAESNAR